MTADRDPQTSQPGIDLPNLRSFFRGYFHQDMKDEYGSPEEAVREFCADASPQERAAVAANGLNFSIRPRDRRSTLSTGS